MNKHLHIICLNVPYPVNYGGVFDLFYKLPALQKQGVKIHLHCFKYGRQEQDILNKFCYTVHYYSRLKGLHGLSPTIPYIVKSRANKELLQVLLQDDHPILMEGIHCTYLLNDKRFNHRKCFVRLHNVEHIYYKHLYKFTRAIFKKLYFLGESILLKQYEKRIATKAIFWSVIEKDAEEYKKLGAKEISYIPLFLPFNRVNTSAGKGAFCLYHGDLSIAENEKAATWLVKDVFNTLQIPLVIAGKNPPGRLQKLLHANKLTCLIADPNEQEMQDLVTKAHINIIPSYNITGIKLKLLNALFNGKHCLVNETTIDGTNLDDLCFIADDTSSFKTAITELYEQPFDDDEICLRQKVLDKMFDNAVNANKFIEQIWSESKTDV